MLNTEILNSTGSQTAISSACALRDEAIERVDQNANSDWKAAALKAIQQVCMERREFCIDDVWDTFRSIEGVFAEQGTCDLRAMGPVMRRAMNAGYCEQTDKYQFSRRANCHRHLRPIWRSNLQPIAN